MISPQDSNAISDGWYVDRKVYTSEEIFQQEKERIFYKTWHFACLKSDLKNPGDYFTMSVVDQPILITHGKDGVLRAFQNACTHRGALLHNKPCGNESRFICMYHAWTFNLNGELIGVPYQDAYGSDFDRKKFNLAPVRVETIHDLVFVTINRDAPPLRDYLGEIVPFFAPYLDGIEVIGRNSWTYEGNWKLWHENFRDNYHPAFTHRVFTHSIPNYADKGGNWALSPGHSAVRWYVQDYNEEAFRRGMARLSNVDFPKSQKFDIEPQPQEVLAIFPNLDIQPHVQSRLPDGSMGSRKGFIQTAVPLGPDKARIDILIYSSVDDDAETRQAVLENHADGQGSWGKISVDDTEAAVRCHAGVRGINTQFSIVGRGVAPGKGGTTEEGFDARDEYSLREFYRMYNEYLGMPELAAAAE